MSVMRIVLMALACLTAFVASCSEAVTPAGTNVATPAATTNDQPTQFSLVSTGDFISQPPLSEQAARDGRETGKPHGDFSRILGAVKPMVSKADLAICHMETPVAAPGDPWTGYPIFNAPLGLVETAAAFGYDSCSTASNHVLDYGEAGLARTLDAFDRAGVKHAG